MVEPTPGQAGGDVMFRVEFQHQLGAQKFAVDFSGDNKVTALFGRSGAGKTTIINAIAGLLQPQSGKIEIAGRTLFDSDRGLDIPTHNRNIGYVFQDDLLFPHMNVAANLRYGADRRSADHQQAKAHLSEIIALLGIEALLQRRPKALSGGERRRVAIGRALASKPDILLLDEPLTGLDNVRKAEILSYIRGLADSLNVTMIYVSHDMREITQIADHLVLVSNGRIEASGPLQEITARLDLVPLTGRFDAGSVLVTKVTAHDPDDDLTALEFAGGRLWVKQLPLAVGTQVRIRIRARDVSLSLSRPHDISMLNIFAGHIVDSGDAHTAQIDVKVNIGCEIMARITKRSYRQLALTPGMSIYALIKSVAVDRDLIAL